MLLVKNVMDYNLRYSEKVPKNVTSYCNDISVMALLNCLEISL